MPIRRATPEAATFAGSSSRATIWATGPSDSSDWASNASRSASKVPSVSGGRRTRVPITRMATRTALTSAPLAAPVMWPRIDDAQEADAISRTVVARPNNNKHVPNVDTRSATIASQGDRK